MALVTPASQFLQAAGEQTEVTIYLANGLAGDTASADSRR